MNEEKDLSKQCRKVLGYLRNHKGMTTIDSYMDLNILSPAKRISELRENGYQIETVWKHSLEGERYGMYILHEDREGYNAEK